MVRLVLLLVIGVGLILFAQFNWSPIALTFLGVQTPPLPLSLWILAAIGAGILTSLLVHSLFTLTHHLGGRRVQTRLRRSPSGAQSWGTGATTRAAGRATGRTGEEDAAWQDWDGYEASSAPPTSKAAAKAAPLDDWETRRRDDWEEYETQAPRSPVGGSDQPQADVKPEPPSGSRTRSPEPRDRPVDQSRPGRAEPVVDADYRVIVPPYQSYRSTSAAPPPQENAEDWFEEDDLETDEQRRRRAGL